MNKSIKQPNWFKKELGIKNIHNKITFDEMVKIINRKNVIVRRSRFGTYDPKEPVHISTNNYGEFCFFDITTTHLVLSVWGLGYHEMRERYVTEFELNYANFEQQIREQPPVNKYNLVQFLIKRKEDDLAYYGKPRPSETGILYGMIADLADDDAAQAEMEDMELL